jgi:hypothetical protein
MIPAWIDVPTLRCFNNELLDGLGADLTDPQLQMINVALLEYHRIEPRNTMKALGPRINMLRRLSLLSRNYRPSAKNQQNAAALAWITKWLCDQAAAKAGYLEVIVRYYQDNEAYVKDASAFLNELKSRRAEVSMPLNPTHSDTSWKTARPGETLVGLHGGVKMERMDPCHRAYEFKFNEGRVVPGTGTTQEICLQEWVDRVNRGEDVAPFFVYIETGDLFFNYNTAAVEDGSHPGCAQCPAIKYYKTNSGELNADVSLLRITGDSLVLRVDANSNSTPFDTDAITPKQSLKGTRDEAHGRKTMAYNWSRHGELLVGLHMEFEFHHSSFASGQLVRCAGMLGGRAGKIYWVDNDSGHYRPPTQNLWRLVKTLDDQGALSTDCRIYNAAASDDSPQKQPAGIDYKAFLANPTERGFALGGHRPSN